jgi:capsular polysaccharide biosynthesis protein
MLRPLRAHWVVALLTGLAAMAAVLVTLTVVPPTYTATTVVALSPRPEARFSGDLLRMTIPSYLSVAGSPSVAADLGRRYGEDPELIQGRISVDNPPASNTLLLSVTWTDPSTAADLANELADVLVAESARDTLLTGSVAAVAVPPAEPTWPPRLLSLVLGGLLSVCLGMAAAWLVHRRRSLATSAREVVELVEAEGLSAPVLAVGTSPAGASEYVARAVGAQLRSGPAEIAQVEFVVVGEAPGPTVALAIGAAAALARQGRSVHVRLREADKARVREAGLDEELRFASPGKLSLGFADLPPAVGPADAEAGQSQEGPDVVFRVIDGDERIRDRFTDKSLVGVVPVVATQVLDQQVRAAVKALRETDAPVLAVCYLLRLPRERSLTDR